MHSPGLQEHPEHTINTAPVQKKVEVFLNGDNIGESFDSLRLCEEGEDERIYIPKKDLNGIELIKYGTYDCPFKGHAVLYHVKQGKDLIKEAAWEFTEPYDEFKDLKGRVAFYPEKFDYIRITN